MKVLLFTRYGRLGASSRVRSLQYLPFLRSRGVEVSVKPLLSDSYLQALYKGGPRWREVIKGYCSRVVALLGAWRFDVVLIEKELFPFLPAFAERFLRLIRVPYIVDFDDALFHRYDRHTNRWVRRLLGRKIDSVMCHSATVIAGNEYLAERARGAGARKVEIIPTVVDLERYRLKIQREEGAPIVGWIGTPETSRYLKPLLPVFEAIKNDLPARFVAVGANPEEFEDTPVEVWPWSEASEVESVSQFDVGIMPLIDSPWERGKCGYKLIQYMACGVPVVASPVGVNVEIVSPPENGLLVRSNEEWGHALRYLLQADSSVRELMGEAGYALVKGRFSLEAQAPQLLRVISEAARGA